MRHLQPQYGPFRPDPYWISRGLELVYIGNKLVFDSRGTIPLVTVTGTPKLVPTKPLIGVATGFGTTFGTGTTDRVNGATLQMPTSGYRSIVAHIYAKTSGGGTLGRVFQDAYGLGLWAGESLYFGTSTQIAYGKFASTQAGQWRTNTAQPLNAWSVFGVSHDITVVNKVPSLYINGVEDGVTEIVGAAGTYSTTPCALTFGNRASDSLRNWDGMIGPVLFFDGFLTAQEHAALAKNPWQVFKSVTRSIVSSSGVTITPSLYDDTDTFYDPSVAPGAVDLTPSLYADSDTFYAAVVGQDGAQDLTPARYDSTNSFFAATVTPGVVTLTPGLYADSDTFYAPTVGQPPVFHDDYERSNISIPDSQIIDDPYSPTIKIYPRLQTSDTSGSAVYLSFNVKITGLNGKRPYFQLRKYLTPNTTLLKWLGYVTQQMMYSYDQSTWTYFDTVSNDADGLNIDFRLNTDFTADTVYISSTRDFSVADTTSLISNLATTYPDYVSMPPSSSGNAYVFDTMAAQTDERGRTVPAQPLYSLKITDPSQQPDDGSHKRVALLFAGIHVEDLGNWILNGALNFLLSADANAVAARKNFEWYVYPMVNPSGRAGGHWRGDWNSAHPTYDPNRRWIATPDMECITKTKAAVLTDISSRPVAIVYDYHSGDYGYYSFSGTEFYSNWLGRMQVYTPSMSTAGSNSTNCNTYWAINTLKAPLAATIEIGINFNPSDSTIAAYGASSIKVASEMFADGMFPVLLPSLYNDADTFYSATVSSGDVTLTPSLYDDSDTFYSPTVAQDGSQFLTPALYQDSDTFYAAAATSTIELTPALYSDADTFYSGTVSYSTELLPQAYVDQDTFYAATVDSTVTLYPDTFTAANTFFAADVSLPNSPQTLTAGLYADTDTFYAAEVAPGTINLTPDLYVDADTFHAAEVAAGNNLFPAAYADADSFFPATVATGEPPIAPELYVDQDVFYAATVSTGSVGLAPSFYINANGFYAASIFHVAANEGNSFSVLTKRADISILQKVNNIRV